MKSSLKQLIALSLVVSSTNTMTFASNLTGGEPENTDDKGKNVGYASYYHDKFNGRKTANGEVYDKTILSAAHRTLPMGSLIRVKRLDNGKAVTLRVNDRGPYSNYMVDLSRAAASELGLVGVKRKVKIEVLNTKPTEEDLIEAANNNAFDNADDQQPPVITAESELQRAGGRAHATKAAASGEAIPEERVGGKKGRRGGRHARGGKHAKASGHAKQRGGKQAKAARGHAKAGKKAAHGHAKAHKRGRRH
jgi:rare lipoprotein A